MRTFLEFIQSKNENFLDTIKGWMQGQGQHPSQDKEFGAAFPILLQRLNGNEKVAVAEFNKLKGTKEGQYALGRMASGLDNSTQKPQVSGDDWNKRWGAINTGGAQIFGDRPGSFR